MRVSWFGHLNRLPEHCPAKQAFYETLKPAKTPTGRPQITRLEIIKKKQLKEIGFDSIYDAIELERNSKISWTNYR